MAKRPTVYDVAALANVSTATVSFTYSKPARVKRETRELVLEAAKTLGYVPSASARGLAAGRTGVLGLYSFDLFLDDTGSDRTGLAVPDDDDEERFRQFPLYVDEVEHGFELECRSRGFATMLGGVRQQERESITDIAGRVDGVAVLAQTAGAADLSLIASRLPVVLISQPEIGTLDRVAADNASGIQSMIHHLMDVHGIDDLVFVGELGSAEIGERYAAFRAAISAAGVADPRHPLDFDHLSGSREFTSELRSFIGVNGLPGAFVCAQDQLALAIMDGLTELGIAVPADVVVTGYDGIVASRLSSPPLTTVRQPMAELGRQAALALIRRLDEPAAAQVNLVLPIQLRVRQSCGCP
jgi:DNA-binding LacI/PurR family transcriptional regulator